MSRSSRIPALLPLVAAVLVAGPLVVYPAVPGPPPAPPGFAEWFDGGDQALAAERFRSEAARSPGDPWPLLGEAMIAERRLDEDGEVTALLALVSAAPAHPLAAVAVRRLGEVAIGSVPAADRVDAALARELAAGRLPGVTAYRARAVRAGIAEMRGSFAEAVRMRSENGIATTWTLAGPFGAFHALDLDRPYPPEKGEWPPPGARTLPAPDGAPSLDGEVTPGEVWYLASDAVLGKGGRYLLVVGTSGSAQIQVDGRPVAERRSWAGWPAAVRVVPVELGPGPHRFLVKLTRGGGRASMALALAREDAAPSDVRWVEATGPGPAQRSGARPRPLQDARELAAALEPEAGGALARLVAARDRMENEREGALSLLDEAVAIAPRAAPIRAARGDAVSGDPSQAERTARGKAEAEWREAARLDPGDAATRLVLAEVAMSGGRLDDAATLLAGLPDRSAGRPRARLVRAHLLAARSHPEAAEELIREASRAGSCAGAAALAEIAGQRDAVPLEDEAALVLDRCPGGAERRADFHRLRGDLAASEAAWIAIARAAPARIDARLSLVKVQVARGNPSAAVAELDDLLRIWPNDPRIHRRRADLLELAGRPADARAARERALALDGSDLGLRRALALEDGAEVLADLAVDGPATIRAYEAAGIPVTTPASLVLDAAAVEAWPDGSLTERTHQVIHVHDARGVERWGEVEVPPGAAVLRIETRKKDGRVLQPESHGGDKRTVSAAGLEPGDYLEMEWVRSLPTRRPASPGWGSDAFYFRGEDLPFFLSTYTVAAPAGSLQLDVRRMAEPAVTRQGGRDVTRAEAHQVEAFVREPGAPGLSEFVPMLVAGSGDGLDGMALSVADALLERIRPGREIDALARSVRFPGGAPPREGEPLLRAAYEVVMERVEGAGPVTDQASHVLSRGRGNRTLLLLALCDALGIRARVALVRPFQVDPQPWRFPRLDLYPVPLVRAEAGGKVFWLDPSTRWAPFGALPAGAQDSEALVLPFPGESLRRERTPADAAPERSEVVLRIEVDEDGDAVLEGTETHPGLEGAGVKAMLESVDELGRRRAFEQTLARSFHSLRLEELKVEGERKVGAPLVVRYRARVSRLARTSGDRLLVEDVPYPSRLTARFATLAARDTPLLIGSGEHGSLRIELTPPPGASPRAGQPVRIEGAHGSYVRQEKVENGRLVRQDRLDLHRARVGVDHYPDFARFAAEVDEAQSLSMDLGEAP